MGKVEHARDLVSGEPDPESLRSRTEAGWRMSAIEWQREAEDGQAAKEAFEPVPYGLRIANDCQHLETDPIETEILTLVMDRIVREEKLSGIANELNQRGYRTRSGGRWSESSVFGLMPRLIESGPRIFVARSAGSRS